jgi:ribonuclease P protein component
MERLTLSGDERLSRKKIIEEIFSRGQSFRTPALVMVYLPVKLPVDFPAQVLFTVSKKNFRRAHDRNRIKRLMREAYRKQKPECYAAIRATGMQYALLFIFTGRQLPDQAYVHGRTQELLRKFAGTIKQSRKDDETNAS